METTLIPVATKITPEMREAIDDYCKVRGATLSNTLRIALERFLIDEGYDVDASVPTWGGARRSAPRPANGDGE
jgi:hypothetical protein